MSFLEVLTNGKKIHSLNAAEEVQESTDVHSGDFLAVSKIRGRWGGYETLEKWVTGAFAGHTAVCLKDEM
ncbi:hypothetical protein RYX36_029193, partial [Vicia faba]